MLPGSRAVLFTSMHGADPRQDGNRGARPEDPRAPRTLIKGGSRPVYTPSGHLLFAQTNTLLAVPFDPGRLEVRGTPRPVQESIGTKPTAAGANYSRLEHRHAGLRHPAAPPAVKGRVVWVGRDGRDLGPIHPRPIPNTPLVPAHFAGWPPPRT